MKFFRVLADNKGCAARWFLDDPRDASGEELDAREFTYGQPYAGSTPVVVPIQQQGRQVAFNLAAFDMPVVSSEIGTILNEIARLRLKTDLS